MQQMPTNLVAGNNTYSSALGSVNQKSGYGMAGFPAGGITEINALARLRSLAGEVQNSTSNLIQVGRIQFLAAVGARAASPC